MSKIFISYTRENFQFVNRIACSLEYFGADIWLDRNNIIAGEEFWEVIVHRMKESDYIFAFFSQEYLEKDAPYMDMELNFYFNNLADREKPQLIPICVNDVNIQDFGGRLSVDISSFHFVDFSILDWEEGISELTKLIEPYHEMLEINFVEHEFLNRIIQNQFMYLEGLWSFELGKLYGSIISQKTEDTEKALFALQIQSNRIKYCRMLITMQSDFLKVNSHKYTFPDRLKPLADITRLWIDVLNPIYRMDGIEFLLKKNCMRSEDSMFRTVTKDVLYNYLTVLIMSLFIELHSGLKNASNRIGVTFSYAKTRNIIVTFESQIDVSKVSPEAFEDATTYFQLARRICIKLGGVLLVNDYSNLATLQLKLRIPHRTRILAP